MFVVYSHEKYNPEANMFNICTCNSEQAAKYVVNALLYRDTCGKNDDSGIYDYYISKIS